MRGLPGRRERRHQHRRNPSRCQRSTVAGWTSTNACLHRRHNRRKISQSRRSVGRRRRSERASTPHRWRSARVWSRRSLRVDNADRSAATCRKASRTARRMASHRTNVNNYCRTRYWRGTVWPELAARDPDRDARHRRTVASARVRGLLALELATAPRWSADTRR
jgi:hypothetical protein